MHRPNSQSHMPISPAGNSMMMPSIYGRQPPLPAGPETHGPRLSHPHNISPGMYGPDHGGPAPAPPPPQVPPPPMGMPGMQMPPYAQPQQQQYYNNPYQYPGPYGDQSAYQAYPYQQPSYQQAYSQHQSTPQMYPQYPGPPNQTNYAPYHSQYQSQPQPPPQQQPSVPSLLPLRPASNMMQKTPETLSSNMPFKQTFQPKPGQYSKVYKTNNTNNTPHTSGAAVSPNHNKNNNNSNIYNENNNDKTTEKKLDAVIKDTEKPVNDMMAELEKQTSNENSQTEKQPSGEFDFNDHKELLNANGRKEGWHLFLTDEESKFVKKILTEALEIKQSFSNFEKEFQKMQFKADDPTLASYRDMWLEWKSRLMDRQNQMSLLQENHLTKYYRNVCQNFPLFVTRGAYLVQQPPPPTATTDTQKSQLNVETEVKNKPTLETTQPKVTSPAAASLKKPEAIADTSTQKIHQTEPNKLQRSNETPPPPPKCAVVPPKVDIISQKCDTPRKSDSPRKNIDTPPQLSDAPIQSSKRNNNNNNNTQANDRSFGGNATNNNNNNNNLKQFKTIDNNNNNGKNELASKQHMRRTDLPDNDLGKVELINSNDRGVNALMRDFLSDVDFQRAYNDFSFLRNQMKFLDRILIQNKHKSFVFKQQKAGNNEGKQSNSNSNKQASRANLNDKKQIPTASASVDSGGSTTLLPHKELLGRTPPECDPMVDQGGGGDGGSGSGWVTIDRSSNQQRPSKGGGYHQSKQYQQHSFTAGGGGPSNTTKPPLSNVVKHNLNNSSQANNGNRTLENNNNKNNQNQNNKLAKYPSNNYQQSNNANDNMGGVDNTRKRKFHEVQSIQLASSSKSKYVPNVVENAQLDQSNSPFSMVDLKMSRTQDVHSKQRHNLINTMVHQNRSSLPPKPSASVGVNHYDMPITDAYLGPVTSLTRTEPESIVVGNNSSYDSSFYDPAKPCQSPPITDSWQTSVQSINSFLKQERRNLEKEKSVAELNKYQNPKYFLTPREYTEEPLYIRELIEPPARTYRPTRIVFVIRGLPGSGKSKLARTIKETEERHNPSASIRILSLDDYMTADSDSTDVELAFDDNKEKIAKNSLVKAFRKTLRDGFFDVIIVDSINVVIEDVLDFYASAVEHKFVPYVIEMEAIVRRILNDCISGEEIVAYCYKHNRLGRSLAEIRTLYERWELLPVEYLRVDAFSLFDSSKQDHIDSSSIDFDTEVMDSQYETEHDVVVVNNKQAEPSGFHFSNGGIPQTGSTISHSSSPFHHQSNWKSASLNESTSTSSDLFTRNLQDHRSLSMDNSSGHYFDENIEQHRALFEKDNTTAAAAVVADYHCEPVPPLPPRDTDLPGPGNPFGLPPPYQNMRRNFY